MRKEIELSGVKVWAVKVDNTFVIWKSKTYLGINDCLGLEIEWDESKFYIYDGCDPFSMPYAKDHVNEGKVLELKTVKKGQPIPKVEKKKTPLKRK